MEDKLPFIYLLKSPNSKYIYEVNRDEIISISDRVYSYLKEVLSQKNVNPEYDTLQEINHLKELGYLSNKRVEKVEHSLTPYLRPFLERKIHKITLQITQGCNLRCSYCIYSDLNNEKQRSHSSKSMTYEMAKQAVDFLLEHSIDNDSVNIGFYGGEPLLKFDLIKDIVVYAERTFFGKNLSFSITTNGTLLTDEIILFFIEHKILLTISIDGPPEIHNSSRRFAKDGSGTFDTILRNMKYIKDKYPKYMNSISINTVINPQNNYNNIESIFTDYDVFNHVSRRSSVIDDTYSVEKTSYSDEYMEDSNYHLFLAYLSCFGQRDIHYIPPTAMGEIAHVKEKMEKMNKMEALPSKFAPGGPCIPGKDRLFISADGNFYPCERINETSEAMRIGSLKDGFDYDSAEKLLNIGRITHDECRNCWAFNHCTACAKHADDGDKLSGKLKSTYCNGIRENLKRDLLNIILIKEISSMY